MNQDGNENCNDINAKNDTAEPLEAKGLGDSFPKGGDLCRLEDEASTPTTSAKDEHGVPNEFAYNGRRLDKTPLRVPNNRVQEGGKQKAFRSACEKSTSGLPHRGGEMMTDVESSRKEVHTHVENMPLIDFEDKEKQSPQSFINDDKSSIEKKPSPSKTSEIGSDESNMTLLPLDSPTPSFDDHNMGSFNQNFFRERAATEKKEHRSDNQSHLFSPERSEKENKHSDGERSVPGLSPSFSLLNQSFESLGAMPQGDSFCGGEYKTQLSSTHSPYPYCTPINTLPTRRIDPAIDISLPPLTHTTTLGGNVEDGSSSPCQVDIGQLPLANDISPTNDYGHSRSSFGKRQPDDEPPARSDQCNQQSRVCNERDLGQSHDLEPYRLEVDASRSIKPHPGSRFFNVLRACHKAFAHFQFLLPCLKNSACCKVNVSAYGGGIQVYNGKEKTTTSRGPSDLEIAKRRIDSAVCAFGGGTCVQARKPSPTRSIFRRSGDEYHFESGSWCSRSEEFYNRVLHQRYYAGKNRLSWDLEESPPVEVSRDPFVTGNRSRGTNNIDATKSGGKKRKISDSQASPHSDGSVSASVSPKPTNMSDGKYAMTTPSPPLTNVVMGTYMEQPKMKYRCKLCGQPKMNHVCPFSAAMQRSIGVSVYPAVNAFTSREPGELAPALSEMNNFLSFDSDQMHHDTTVNSNGSCLASSSSVSRSSTQEKRRGVSSSPRVLPNVTPDTSRPSLWAPRAHTSRSPQSSWSTSSASPPQTPPTVTHFKNNGATATHCSSGPKSVNVTSTVSPFVEEAALRPEQYRCVTPRYSDPPTAYKYPSLPLPYRQRKRLSDTLFVMSRQVPRLTEDCACVLREARNCNMWDQGVAEVTTQVLVVLYCKEGDMRLDGLSEFLLSLGVAC